MGSSGIVGAGGQEVLEVDVRADRGVGVVAADDLGGFLGEREADDQVEARSQLVARGAQPGQHRLEVGQRLEQVVLAGADHAGADHAEPVERREHRDQLVVLVGEHLDRRAGHVERAGHGLLLAVEGRGQVVDRLHGPDDVGLLVVEGPDHVGERGQQVAQVLLAPVHRLVELLGDGAELGHATAAEQERQRAEHLLDLGVAAGRRRAGCWSPSPSRSSEAPSAGGSRATYFSPRRLTWRISAIALSGRSTSLRTIIVTLACQPTRSTSVTSPTVTSSTITGDFGTMLRMSSNSAVDRDRVVGVDRPAGQRQVVGAVELARGQQQRRRDEEDQPSSEAAHEPPPSSSVIVGVSSEM